MTRPMFAIVFAIFMVLSSETTAKTNSSDNHNKGAFVNCSEITNDYVYFRYYNHPQVEGGLVLKENTDNFTDPSEDLTTPFTVSYTTDPDPKKKKTCVVPVVSSGQQYNWWQILLNNAGKPGTLKKIERRNNTNPVTYHDPCKRPLYVEGEDLKDYSYEHSDFKTFYRKESATQRFPGTLQEFLEIDGLLIWFPPKELNDTRGYRISYALSDIGFWVKVYRQNCYFYETEGKPSLSCSDIPSCSCTNDELHCFQYASGTLNSNLLATLVGK